ncbi:hypothetical protein PR048_033346 [Dryococelus australis]|uniref:Uncharacterized protein n=1 Tax=Dryococelus australis TaxID=614101 RepID=A0ABQ9G012_9NEOP|nr:hypothetical protein PR048_033346 [Dryococelus australis]
MPKSHGPDKHDATLKTKQPMKYKIDQTYARPILSSDQQFWIRNPMRVIEVNKERRRNERPEETGDPRENPPTNVLVGVLYITGPASFLRWLLRTSEATPFLTELLVIGTHSCDVLIYWRRVTQGVSAIVWSNDKRLAKRDGHLLAHVGGPTFALPNVVSVLTFVQATQHHRGHLSVHARTPHATRLLPHRSQSRTERLAGWTTTPDPSLLRVALAATAHCACASERAWRRACLARVRRHSWENPDNSDTPTTTISCRTCRVASAYGRRRKTRKVTFGKETHAWRRTDKDGDEQEQTSYGFLRPRRCPAADRQLIRPHEAASSPPPPSAHTSLARPFGMDGSGRNVLRRFCEEVSYEILIRRLLFRDFPSSSFDYIGGWSWQVGRASFAGTGLVRSQSRAKSALRIHAKQTAVSPTQPNTIFLWLCFSFPLHYHVHDVDDVCDVRRAETVLADCSLMRQPITTRSKSLSSLAPPTLQAPRSTTNIDPSATMYSGRWPMRVIEVVIELRRNEREGETEDPRENPPIKASSGMIPTHENPDLKLVFTGINTKSHRKSEGRKDEALEQRPSSAEIASSGDSARVQFRSPPMAHAVRGLPASDGLISCGNCEHGAFIGQFPHSALGAAHLASLPYRTSQQYQETHDSKTNVWQTENCISFAAFNIKEHRGGVKYDTRVKCQPYPETMSHRRPSQRTCERVYSGSLTQDLPTPASRMEEAESQPVAMETPTDTLGAINSNPSGVRPSRLGAAGRKALVVRPRQALLPHRGRPFTPMRVIEGTMERRRNEGAGETGDPRENSPTNGIVRGDSHLRKFGYSAADRTPVRLGGRRANRSATAAPTKSRKLHQTDEAPHSCELNEAILQLAKNYCQRPISSPSVVSRNNVTDITDRRKARAREGRVDLAASHLLCTCPSAYTARAYLEQPIRRVAIDGRNPPSTDIVRVEVKREDDNDPTCARAYLTFYHIRVGNETTILKGEFGAREVQRDRSNPSLIYDLDRLLQELMRNVGEDMPSAIVQLTRNLRFDTINLLLHPPHA